MWVSQCTACDSQACDLFVISWQASDKTTDLTLRTLEAFYLGVLLVQLPFLQ